MSRKHYPAEYREQIVKLARAGRSIVSLAREFEPTEPTIRSWIAAADDTVPPEEVERRCFAAQSDAESKIIEYIDGFYNRTRLHSALDFRSPREFAHAHTERKAAKC